MWNDWTNLEKAQQLAMSLRGQAQKSLSNLSAQQLTDYEAIKQILTQRYNPKERCIAHRSEFVNIKQGKYESCVDFSYQVRRLATLAYPDVSYHELENHVIDQFIRGLNNVEIKKKVVFSHPKTLDEAVSSAVEYESVVGNCFKKPTEYQERVAVTQLRNYPESDTDKNSNLSLDQIAEMIDQKLQKFVNTPRQVNSNVCFYCKKEGHFKNKCPKLQAKLAKQNRENETSEN